MLRQIQKTTKQPPLRSDQKMGGNVVPHECSGTKPWKRVLISERHKTVNTLLHRLLQKETNFKRVQDQMPKYMNYIPK